MFVRLLLKPLVQLDKFLQFFKESERLESLNIQLQREQRELIEEKEKLMYILNVHLPNCPLVQISNNDNILFTNDTNES